MPRQSAVAVVRVTRGGVQHGEVFLFVAAAVAVGIPDPEDAVPFRQIDPPVGAQFKIHGGVGPVVEKGRRLMPSIAVPVGVNDDAVMFGPDVTGRSEMGVRGDGPDAAVPVDVDARGRHHGGIGHDLGERDTGLH